MNPKTTQFRKSNHTQIKLVLNKQQRYFITLKDAKRNDVKRGIGVLHKCTIHITKLNFLIFTHFDLNFMGKLKLQKIIFGWSYGNNETC